MKRFRLRKLYNTILRKVPVFKSAQALPWPESLGKKESYQSLLGREGYQRLVDLTEISRDEKEALLEAALFLADVGLPDHAEKAFKAYLSLEPNSPLVHQYLQLLMYTSPERYDNQYLYDAHVKHGDSLKSGTQYKDYSNPLTHDRRLKIGYTCHFVTNSTSSTLLLPILKAHNRERVEIFMYSDQDPEQTSDEVRKLADHWYDTHGLNDDEYCEQIRKDNIDVLLELNGHCYENRYRAITRKPAPVQVSYYNYASTCGVPGIDYFLTGEELKIDYLQPYFSEKIFNKKGVVIATPVSAHFPAVNPPPVLKKGYITFGSFGQAHKISREQIQLWCEVLKQIPDSRFYMKAGALDCPVKRSIFRNHFSASGIDMNRIKLEGSSDYQTLLNCYAEIDIALDSYPFGAGTTTIEGVIQGVPTISLFEENRLATWNCVANLHNIGHDELIGHSKAEFIKKAVELANDHERLSHYRHTLREDLLKSPRGNMPRFISELEDAYFDMWKNYINERG